jgi:hypothetical protein
VDSFSSFALFFYNSKKAGFGRIFQLFHGFHPQLIQSFRNLDLLLFPRGLTHYKRHINPKPPTCLRKIDSSRLLRRPRLSFYLWKYILCRWRWPRYTVTFVTFVVSICKYSLAVRIRVHCPDEAICVDLGIVNTFKCDVAVAISKRKREKKRPKVEFTKDRINSVAQGSLHDKIWKDDKLSELNIHLHH